MTIEKANTSYSTVTKDTAVNIPPRREKVMERLTNRMNDGTAYVQSETGAEGVGHFTTQRRLPELIAKLAAYEDTGLTPVEVERLKLQIQCLREDLREYEEAEVVLKGETSV